MNKIGRWFVFQNYCLLIAKDNAREKLLTTSQINHLTEHFVRQYKVGQLEKEDIYCAELNDQFSLPAHFETISLRKALELLPSDWHAFIVKAFSIINWDKNHQYCGRCGNKTDLTQGTFERLCKHCSIFFYPRISPSIIVLIQKGDFILMARGHHFIPEMYGLIAGFIEVGENVEEAIHREIMEEVGIKVKNINYVGSQPWPFPDSLMLAFTADHASGEIVINSTEIEDADWYHFNNLPKHSFSKISITRKLITDFVHRRKVKKT